MTIVFYRNYVLLAWGLAQFRGVISANRLMEVYLMATVYIQVASSVGTGIVSHPQLA